MRAGAGSGRSSAALFPLPSLFCCVLPANPIHPSSLLLRQSMLAGHTKLLHPRAVHLAASVCFHDLPRVFYMAPRQVARNRYAV